jgi:hypothetical protein
MDPMPPGKAETTPIMLASRKYYNDSNEVDLNIESNENNIKTCTFQNQMRRLIKNTTNSFGSC